MRRARLPFRPGDLALTLCALPHIPTGADRRRYPFRQWPAGTVVRVLETDNYCRAREDDRRYFVTTSSGDEGAPRWVDAEELEPYVAQPALLETLP